MNILTLAHSKIGFLTESEIKEMDFVMAEFNKM
jgi:hypothetical protein